MRRGFVHGGGGRLLPDDKVSVKVRSVVVVVVVDVAVAVLVEFVTILSSSPRR